MNYSKETQAKIQAFAKEQSQHYLNDAEMTYMEKLRQKTGQTRRKINKKLARFRLSSEDGLEARNDMILYMSDYIDDLISQGIAEEDALEKACAAMEYASEAEQAADIREHFLQYYSERSPQDYESIGLFYAAFFCLGLCGGGLTGFLVGGGRSGFLPGGWIDTLIGAGVGVLLGITLGLMSHAIATRPAKR